MGAFSGHCETSRRFDDSSGSYITCVLEPVPTVVNIIDNQVRAELLLSRHTNIELLGSREIIDSGVGVLT